MCIRDRNRQMRNPCSAEEEEELVIVTKTKRVIVANKMSLRFDRVKTNELKWNVNKNYVPQIWKRIGDPKSLRRFT